MNRDINWSRRRLNLKILFAAQGTNATKVAEAAQLSANTLSKFTNGHNSTMSEDALHRVVISLGLTGVQDLDTDNILGDPKIAIRKLIETIPEPELAALLSDLKNRFARG